MSEKVPTKENSPEEFTVYGQPWCGYCSGALRLLDQQGLEYSYIDIREQAISKQELGEKLGRPIYTVPQILHGDRYIGGYTDLVPYLRDLKSIR
jgi:glutaredoxin 1